MNFRQLKTREMIGQFGLKIKMATVFFGVGQSFFISCLFSAISANSVISVCSVVNSRQFSVKVKLVGISNAHIHKVTNWQIAARNQHFTVNFG